MQAESSITVLLANREKYYSPYNPYALEIQPTGVEALSAPSYWTMSAFNITHVMQPSTVHSHFTFFQCSQVNQLDPTETTITPALVWLWERYKYNYLTTRLSSFSDFR